MKRKKKAGGYNLRKSLAWDRAFFTDEGIFLFSFSFFFFAFLLVLLLLEKKEFNFSLMYFFLVLGVLNSTELSLISGNIDKSSGEKLLVIEEEVESLSGDSQDLQALENNLFKELPLNNSNKKEEKKIGSSLPPRSSGSTPRSAVS